MALPFRKNHPAALRLWHWLNALAMLGLLGTVFLRKTFLSWRTNAAAIQSKAEELGATGLTAESAATIAKHIREPMWEWHYTLGFALVGLLLVRLGMGLFDARHAPVRSLLREAATWLGLAPAQRKGALHYLVVRAGYAVFYGAVLFMSASGLTLYFKKGLGVSKEVASGLKEAHEAAMWFFVFFTAVHLVGVVVAELRGERGLVSRMISGGPPDEAAPLPLPQPASPQQPPERRAG